jgi:hypothetical protein
VGVTQPASPARLAAKTVRTTNFFIFVSLASGNTYDPIRRFAGRSDTSQSAPGATIWHTNRVRLSCRTAHRTGIKKRRRRLKRDAARTTLACRGRSHERSQDIRYADVTQAEIASFVTAGSVVLTSEESASSCKPYRTKGRAPCRIVQTHEQFTHSNISYDCIGLHVFPDTEYEPPHIVEARPFCQCSEHIQSVILTFIQQHKRCAFPCL